MIFHLVDGQDPIAHQLCLGGDKCGEHKTRTITQHQSVTDVQRLKEGEGEEGDEGEERIRRKVGVGLGGQEKREEVREREENAGKAQTKQRRKVKQANLEVFCSSWSSRDRYLLALEEGVDGGALANVRVANLEQDDIQ